MKLAYGDVARRMAIGVPFALAGAIVIQVLGALVSVLVTRTSGFGGPLAAGSLNIGGAERAQMDPIRATVDVLLTALVLCIPAYRSAAHVAGATVIGAVLYVAAVAGLPNASLPITHAAWWIIAMLPALVLGLLPNLRALL